MFLTNLVYLFHIVFHCILLFVSVAHRDLTVYALINMALLLLLLLLEHLQLHNGLQHWLHSMALRISKLFYLWLTPADPCKISDPINALHSGLGSFLPIFGGHRAFLRNLTSG